jgi:hypothetical protein
MHRTLKAETARPPEADLESQQRRFDAFRKEFNEIRPHEALVRRQAAGSAVDALITPIPQDDPRP